VGILGTVNSKLIGFGPEANELHAIADVELHREMPGMEYVVPSYVTINVMVPPVTCPAFTPVSVISARAITVSPTFAGLGNRANCVNLGTSEFKAGPQSAAKVTHNAETMITQMRAVEVEVNIFGSNDTKEVVHAVRGEEAG
jgi:hypothetical protein